MYLEHQTLGRRVICPSEPANQRIILKIDGFLYITDKKRFLFSEKLYKENKLLFGILVVFWEQIWQICILLKKIDHSQFSLFSTVDFAKLLCSFFLVVSFSCCIAFQIGVWQQWKTRVFIKRFAKTYSREQKSIENWSAYIKWS